MYKAKDLRERNVDDLKELEKSLRSDMFQSRLKNFTNRLDDTSSMKKARRDLGRVLTVLGEKSRGVTVVSKEPSEKPAKKAAAPAKAKAPKAKAAAAEGEAPAEKKTTKRATKSAKSEAK